MADEPKVDIRKVLEEGAQRTTLSDLAQKGFTNVKVLDEKAIEELILKAVDKVVSTQTEEQRARIVATSRKELDRLMKERNDFMTRAGMLEAGKNDLVQQVEKLQGELKIRRQIEEQGEAGFMAQLKEIVERTKILQEQVQPLQEENVALKADLEAAREENGRLAGEIERLQADADASRAETEGLKERLAAAEEESRGSLEAARREGEELRAQVEAEREKAGLAEEEKARASEAGRELEKARGEIAALKGRMEEEREKIRRELEESKGREAELERRLKQAAEAAERPKAPPAKTRRKAEAAPAAPPPEPAPAPSPAPAPPAKARPAPAAPARRAAAGPLPFKEGKGLDIGTVNLVAAEQDEKGDVLLRLMRNAFMDVPIDTSTKSILTRLKVPYAMYGNKMYVLGGDAFELANVLNRNTRRPMKDGLISPKETDALPVMKLLIGAILGEPRVPDEVCYYSVPGDPIDSDLSVLYHRDLFDAVLKSLGYAPRNIIEGHAVTFAELSREDFTGIGISCGGGMFNICVVYKSMPALHFSTSRAGDWLDQNAAQALGIKPSRVALIKEKGVDLMNPKSREEDAISIYYRELIRYNLANIKERFLAAENMPSFNEPISIVFSGGTSMAGGFIEAARQVFRELDFPIPVKELRLAGDPLHATAKGCLTAALLEMAQRAASP